MVMVGTDKRFIHCNDAFCRFLGYPEKELTGKTITEVTHPKDRDLGMQELKSIIDGALETATIQKRYLRKNGMIVWGEIILTVKNDQFIGKTIEEAFPNLTTTNIPDAYRDVARNGIPFNMEQILYSDDQSISGAFEISAFQTETNKMAVLFRDVTEKKKAKEVLHASKRRFKELFKNSTDSITILDKNGLQIHVSDVVEKMLGYKKLEAWGTNQLENPDIRGVAVNVRDITERKRAEGENEQLMQRLNQI